MSSFGLAPKVGFDTETTGTNVHTDRIVTAALVFSGGGLTESADTHLINPGVPIPSEVSAIHGVTTEMALAGQDPAAALEAIASKLAEALTVGMPVVAFNLAFDWTILDSELARYGLASVADRVVNGPVLNLIDPLVIDRQIDRYRRGPRKLKDVAAHYGVAPQEWHTAEADAVAAVQIAEAQFAKWPRLDPLQPARLYADQQGWHRRWAAGYQAYLRRSGNPAAVVDGSWPLLSSPAEVAA